MPSVTKRPVVSPGARYHALLIPSCPGALADLASSGSLARILQHFRSESSKSVTPGTGLWGGSVSREERPVWGACGARVGRGFRF